MTNGVLHFRCWLYLVCASFWWFLCHQMLQMSRMLAGKAALAIRVDALGDETNCEMGLEHRAKLESRIRQMENRGVSRVCGFVSLCDDSNLDILWQILSCLVTTFCSGHVCYEGRQLMTCPFCYYFCDMTILVTGVADNLSEDVFLNVKLSHCVWYWRKQCLYVCAAKSGK